MLKNRPLKPLGILSRKIIAFLRYDALSKLKRKILMFKDVPHKNRLEYFSDIPEVRPCGRSIWRQRRWSRSPQEVWRAHRPPPGNQTRPSRVLHF